MKLDDIARMAISEVSAELEKIEALQNKKQEELERENLKKELLAIETADEQALEEPKVEASVPSAQSAQIEPEPKVAQISPKNREISEEEIFLANLAERIEVLFEGLKQTSEQDLNQRLELTTKFLEFTLANIENRLQNLSK
ncbi:CiaD-like domain-containing protein [Campylobacter concisus]|uniref:GlcNAc transferase n=2 Tax=Campylobacter concisus TaxID=199 RepID=A0A7S9S995_9BACT|nr:GlcNAc transferase [Campylobacter concisus]QPH97921.1 GlcNAc transferase [Campylobacter concisus]QPI05766.1 GlcNAc transferase [Campylobacter concisus]